MSDSLPSPQEPIPTDDDESDEITCWCGAHGTYEDLFSPLPARCGGHGVIDCYCGGDLCVCHNHGEVECFGCVDCEDADDDLEYYFASDGEGR